MNFRQKIFYSQIALFFALLLILLLSCWLMLPSQMTLIGICVSLLAINAMGMLAIVQKIMRPVQKIMDAIQSYKEGESLPHIDLQNRDEFSKLASIINALTNQIRKQIDFLTRQREETEEIVESIREGILAFDPSARVIFANTAACRMLGVTKESLLGKTLEVAELDDQDLLKKCHEMIVQTLQTAESNKYTWMAKGAIFFDLISAPLAQRNGSLLVLQDKTSDYRIVELGKEFIANASHELRTPITIIRGYAETLQDLPTISRKMMEEITEKIVKTCIRLDKLVHSLLTLADLEHVSQEKFIPIDLVLLVENCMQTLLFVHPHVKVKLHSKLESAKMAANGDLFELAVMNLLENAVKYSLETAEIDISIELIRKEIHLSVADQGIGIAEDALPHIFERFFTVDKARSRKKGGAGLGLAIVKTIIGKHFGKVVATSKLGQGSVFTLILHQ